MCRGGVEIGAGAGRPGCADETTRLTPPSGVRSARVSASLRSSVLATLGATTSVLVASAISFDSIVASSVFAPETFFAAAFFGAAVFFAAAFFSPAAFLAVVFFAGLSETSSGCTSRIKPSRSARARIRSACASMIVDDGPFTPMPSLPLRSMTSAFVIPSSLAIS